MSSAALLAGNTVLLKPAEQSTLIAREYHQLLLEAGVPKDVVMFCPCDGESVFSQVCDHPKIKQIAFTGSKEVGLQLYQKSSVVKKGQRHIQQVFSEMGGKNSAYVDDDADFDEVIPNILYSAFAFAGQKCSALSRLFVHKNIKGDLLSRLVESLSSLKVCSSLDASCDIGPLVDDESYCRVIRLLSEAESDPHLKLIYKGSSVPEQGFFVPPAIYEADDIEHRFLQEEFFAPILTIMEVEDFEQGLEAINHSSFGLTASVYSRHPNRLEKVQMNCEVGNLYLNRGCTGAIVGRQPFGGLKLSGTGLKAGGAGYLKQFAEARTITENTCRHGFVSHET
jgi:RHH-type proline utilization regulon transcriptional repressor/proline dehydrogenase/delta 1-pyrroline-5-carboxylate dehydrogenase